jgi:hypothetical protein
MPIRLRPFDPESDVPRLAAIQNTIDPEPVTVAILRELETRLPPGLVRRRMAAVTPDGSVAGFGTAMRHAWMPEAPSDN